MKSTSKISMRRGCDAAFRVADENFDEIERRLIALEAKLPVIDAPFEADPHPTGEHAAQSEPLTAPPLTPWRDIL